MMTRLVNTLLIGAACLGATPALAKQEYAAYEGRDAVHIGQGGTKVTENGIDYWTTGSPPRRFQVLGVLTDARKNRLLDGEVIGSKSVAKKTKAAGGDAVIVAGSSTDIAGIVRSANIYGTPGGLSAFGASNVVNRTTTRLIVVKYLPD